jgi:hypothetical protein
VTAARLMVELVGGPWDGHQQELMTTADLDRPLLRACAWSLPESRPGAPARSSVACWRGLEYATELGDR